MKGISKLVIILVFIISLSCSSDDEVGNLDIQFTTTLGGEVFLLQNTYAKNGNENFSVDELKYIISNVILIDNRGNEYIYPQKDSYFLINEEALQSQRITLQNVNANSYTGIRFGIGVDQSNYPLNGVDNFVPTAEENDMMWSWSAGYIFMKIEGTYSSAQTGNSNFRYHIGSHGENLDNYREVSLDFLQPVSINKSQTPKVNIDFDILKLFSAEHEMLLVEKDDIQIDPENAPKITDNYTQAFEIGMN